jgi:thiol-disulfide isomerase/thioredoxin
MKFKLIAILAISFTSLAACSNVSDKSTESDAAETVPAVTENAAAISALPNFKMKGTDGKIINLADMKGKKVFVNLWATWCPPCKAEIPSIENLYNKLDKEKTVFVMLSLDDDFELAKNYAQKNKMKLPVYAPADNIPPVFNTNGIPATFIFDEQGALIKVNNGMDNYDTDSYVQLLK